MKPCSYFGRLTHFLGWILLTVLAIPLPGRAEPIALHGQVRVRTAADTNRFEPRDKLLNWESTRTAVVICDMWDKHHCPDATERVGEMVPRMNQVIAAARAKGMLILHCPSDTMDFYKDHLGRKLAQAAPKVETAIPLKGWCSLNGGAEPSLPIDDSDGGCDGCPDCPSYKAWSRQHPGLEIRDGDAITDSTEAYYLMRQRGITNVIVLGVHINMCVLGRPFSIRQMVTQGQNVVLMRDMTDSMYNHRKSPWVSHFRGTELVAEHIESYWCPSITSVDFLGGEPFRFKADQPKHVVFVIGENEYHTWETLPEFAARELAWRGYKISYVTASIREGDGEFSNWEVIPKADLLVFSVRRRPPPAEMMTAIRAHISAGKPVAGIRTAIHAFELRNQTAPPERVWPNFDEDVFGADYQDHYGTGPGKSTVVRQLTETAGNPILNGLSPTFNSTSHLYRSRKLKNTVTPLLRGQTEDGTSDSEPVAWINTAENRRVFYTSLGSSDDFKNADFRRLLLNGILWAVGDIVPPAPARKAESTTPPSTPQTPTKADATPQLEPWSPQHSAASFHTPEDLVFEQVLAEPTVTQPVFLTFDSRQRLWVVEYRQYPHPAGLKMVSRDNFWRAVYDKVPPPPPRHFKGADRITIHEDTKGNGVYDKHTTFVDGLNIATSVAFSEAGVYVLNPPYLLFYPDRNHDDVPDGDPEVLLSGFGLEDTHSVANSLRWGPDGWLYGCQGSTVTGNILVHGNDGKALSPKPISSQGQNIWRYHPSKRIYEVFSEGGGNAFGLELDSAGRLFSGHNGGNTRGFHYQQGAYLQKGFDKHGPLSNPYAYGYFPAMPHPDVDRFTHNFLIYDSGVLGPAYQGRLFGVEPLQGRVVMSELIPEGATFRTRDVGYAVTSEDRWFRPVDIKLGPDGALYVADWYDRQVNHYRNHEGQLDVSNGRVYRLRARNKPATRAPDVSRLPSDKLVALLQSPIRTLRQQALQLLADRQDHSVTPSLEALRNGASSLEVFWALYRLGAWVDADAVKGLTHANPQVRSWTARLLGDERRVSPGMAQAIERLALIEPDLEVRNQLAATARRLPAGPGLALVRGLLTRDADAGDARQPLMLWWAIEEKVSTDPEAVLTLFSDRELWRSPLVEQHLLSRLMRRFAASGRREDLNRCAKLFELSPGAIQTARLTQGFEEAFQGRPLAGLPEGLMSAMERAGGESVLLAARRGRPDALSKALDAIRNAATDPNRRLQLIQVFGELRTRDAVPVLLALAREEKRLELRSAALGALQLYASAELAGDILALFPVLPSPLKPAAFGILTARPGAAEVLLQGVESGRFPKAEVPSTVVRRLQLVPGGGFQERVNALWPNVHPAGGPELEREITRLTGVIDATTGSPYAGKKLFLNQCGVCHRLFGKGAEVGPDLTAYPRSDLATLLLNVVNPNAEIREGYEAFFVETRDGRTLTGFIADRDGQTVVLRTPDGQTVPLPRAEVVRLDPAGSSLMPEGLLSGLKDQEVRDLFAYLRSTQPLNDGN